MDEHRTAKWWLSCEQGIYFYLASNFLTLPGGTYFCGQPETEAISLNINVNKNRTYNVSLVGMLITSWQSYIKFQLLKVFI